MSTTVAFVLPYFPYITACIGAILGFVAVAWWWED